MYKFTDANDNEWHASSDTYGLLKITKYFNGTDRLALNQQIAKELIVRLQFFVEHGRLPKEAPGLELQKLLNKVLVYSSDKDPNFVSRASDDLVEDEEEDEEDLEEDITAYLKDLKDIHAEDYYDDSELGTMCEDLADVHIPESLPGMYSDYYDDNDDEAGDLVWAANLCIVCEKETREPMSEYCSTACYKARKSSSKLEEQTLYIVHASKEERSNQAHVVGVFDDRDVAECEQDNYLYDLEQAGHDTALFSFSIEETSLNKISADIPKR